MKNKTLWLVETAVILALLIVLQWATKPFGTLVTGSVVNFLLIAATVTVGIWSGVVIGVVSPFMAMLWGIAPLPIYIVPVVALGNAALVIVYGLLLKLARDRSRGGKIAVWIGTVAAASVLKFCVLFAGVNWLVVPLVTTVTGAAAKAPAAIMSAMQIVTALIGGVLAMLIIPTVLKAVRRNSTFSQNNL